MMSILLVILIYRFYNPVNDLIEPTLREGFIKKLKNSIIDKIEIIIQLLKSFQS